MSVRPFLSLVSVVLLPALLGGCAKDGRVLPNLPGETRSMADGADSRERVAVSILPQKYFLEKIAGDRFQITVMVPPGASPETYEPKPQQLQALSGAIAYFQLDVPFEQQWLRRLQGVNGSMALVDTSRGITKLFLEDHHHHGEGEIRGHGDHDDHDDCGPVPDPEPRPFEGRNRAAGNGETEIVGTVGRIPDNDEFFLDTPQGRIEVDVDLPDFRGLDLTLGETVTVRGVYDDDDFDAWTITRPDGSPVFTRGIRDDDCDDDDRQGGTEQSPDRREQTTAALLDPHIWLSPRLAKIQGENIYQALVTFDPENEATYQRNFEKFLEELDTLDQTIRDRLAPLQNRKFMVFHPSWQYFADDYDLEMVAIEIGGTEPSAAELSNLIQTAKDQGVKVIFAQPEFSQTAANLIAKEIGGEVVLISPLAENWQENLAFLGEQLAIFN